MSQSSATRATEFRKAFRTNYLIEENSVCANCGCEIPEDKHDDDRNINWSQIVAAAEANNQTPAEAVENMAKMAEQQGAK